MTEQQANKIIELLEGIDKKLHAKSTYTIDNIGIKISHVESNVRDIEKSIKDLHKKIDKLDN